MLFIENKYTIWYNKIINSSKIRQLPIDVYTERHHIIPKSFGGSNDSSNIAILTAREHFVCHLLLVKMTSNKEQIKMIHASWRMVCPSNRHQPRHKTTSRLYQKIREDYIMVVKNRKMTDETKQKLREANIGKKHSAVSKEKMSKSRVGITLDAQFGIELAEKIREKRSISLKGKNAGKTPRLGAKLSEESKKKISDKAKLRKIECKYCKNQYSLLTYTRYHDANCKLSGNTDIRLMKTCIYCRKTIDPGNYARYHGGNCKLKH